MTVTPGKCFDGASPGYPRDADASCAACPPADEVSFVEPDLARHQINLTHLDMAPSGNAQVNAHGDLLSTAKRILEQLAGRPLPDWDRVEPLLRHKTLQPSETLFRAGVTHPFVYFVESGIIKMIYETCEGDAWVKAFAAEERFFASLAALTPGGTTSFSAIAACPASVESLPYHILEQLGDRHAQWQRALRRSFELYAFRKECRERDLLTLSAEERYQRFIEEYPHIARRVTDRDIAGYVRVTPAALSRIKARIRQSHAGV